MTHKITRGISTVLIVTVKEDGTAKDVSAASTITVGLFNQSNVLQLSVAASSGHADADWTNGVVAVTLTTTNTDSLTAGGGNSLWPAIKVDTSDIWVKADMEQAGQHIDVEEDVFD